MAWVRVMAGGDGWWDGRGWGDGWWDGGMGVLARRMAGGVMTGGMAGEGLMAGGMAEEGEVEGVMN